MDYMVLPARKMADSNILPASLKEMAGKGELLVIGGCTNAGKLGCVAAFAAAPFHRDEAVLKYIYVAESERRKRYGHGLLEYGCNLLSGAGIRTVTVRMWDAGDDVYKFFRYEKFVPLTFQGRVYEYPISVFTEDERFDKLPAERLKKAITVEGCHDYRLMRFRERAKREHFLIDDNHFDPVFSHFYEENQELTACLLARRCGENILFFPRGHMLGSCTEQRTAWLYLFAASIKAAGNLMPKDTVVQIQSFVKAGHHFLQQITQNGGKVHRIQELARRV